ncbi:MAG: hypothetical protein ACI4DO_09515 [Roseburia sp.]
MAKKVLIWCAKVVAAGITAFGILALFCVFYYNPPVHVACEDGATCYKREPGSYWSRGTEGFASGRIDENGYNNSYNTDTDHIDLLMMGSSQTEGLYVDDDLCASRLLGEMFAQDGRDYKVYNIGMSAHTIYQNAYNLDTALSVYEPARYVAIETGVVSYDGVQYQAIVDGSYEEIVLPEYPAVLDWAQRVPYVKLLYQQYKNYQSQDLSDDPVDAGADAYYSDAGIQSTENLLDYMNERVTAQGCTLILYYIPEVGFDSDGNMYFASDESTRDTFAAMCQERGILFVDMARRMQQAYEEDDVVGTGFSNTTVGYGHLNREGHAMLAEEIYQAIDGKEAKP